MTCELCGKKIKTGDYVFIGCWETGEQRNRVMRYHIECFEEIAGREILEKLRRNDDF